MATIDIVGLDHRYPNGHRGLVDINLTIHDSEFVALLGPSGSGKTTLLRTIAGFIRPSGGTIHIGAETIVDATTWVPPEKRGLGMVFQDRAVWPHMSVRNSIAYPLRRARLPRADIARRVAALLEKVGLSDYATRRPSRLSGGQQQRVALARAIVAHPDALLLDEALSALDEPLRARLRLELKRLTHEEGLTTVHVTHDRAEALALADRVVVLNQGRIAQIGAPRELLEAPANSFVASFVADAAVFDGSVVGERFYPDHPELVLPSVGHGTVLSDRPERQGRSQRAVATVSPDAVTLEPLRELRCADIPPVAAGTVTSVLRGQYGSDISVDWAGTPVQVRAEHTHVSEGDKVRLRVKRAHVFVGEAISTHGAHAVH